jgi:hypothetical protein
LRAKATIKYQIQLIEGTSMSAIIPSKSRPTVLGS